MYQSSIIIIMICSLASGQTTDLFFSEYAEGSEGNNKYIEIYNGTGADIDLSNYQVWGSNNGGNWKSERQHSLSGTLTDGSVYVIAADAASQAILDETDLALAYESAVHYNGDDAVGLAKNNGSGTFELIDVIGIPDNDPGTGWDVGGVTGATQDHTLIRKESVVSGNTDWTSSAGTSVNDSEWFVDLPPTHTFTPETLGSHLNVGPAIEITSPADGETIYSSDVTVSFISRYFTIATAGNGDGHVHYELSGDTTIMQYTTNDIELTGLTEGYYSFIIWLVNDNHVNLTPHVADTIYFTVSQPQSISIAEAHNQALGTKVTVRGIVTTPNFQTSNTEYGLQDPTAGIVIFLYGDVLTLNVGDSVEVTGDLDAYNGKLEIVPGGMSDITVISSGNSLPAFQELSVATLIADGEDYESELIRINNASISSGSWPASGESVNLTISDNGGVSEVEMRIDSDMDIIGNPEPSTPFNVQGIAGQYNSYQILPRYYTDFSLGEGVAPSITEVHRTPCIVTSTDQVLVSAEITDNSTITQAFVHYRFAGAAWDSVSLSLGDNDTWSGNIPSSVDDNVFVEYYISGYDDGVDQSGIIKSSHFPDIEDGNYMGYISKNGDLTIKDLQYSPWPSGDSPYFDCTVTVSGIVTADSVDYLSGSFASYALQSESAQWSGIFFNGENLSGVARGNEITITGEVIEDNGNTNIDGVTTVTILSSDNVVSPLLVSTADLAQDSDEIESYEGCLVVVSDVTISSLNQDDWSIKDDSNIDCLMDDVMATTDANNFMSELVVGNTLQTVTGIFNFDFGKYKIDVRDMADFGQLAIDDEFDGVATEFALFPNYPNPFNPDTRIRFRLANNSTVKLLIYDVRGRKVRTLVSNKMDAGHHEVYWDGFDDEGNSVASGVYLYHIQTRNFIAYRKMLLVK